MKRLFRWGYVILWMGVIFWFSSQPDLHSSLESFWDFIFRKIAHISEYFVLTYLVFRAIRENVLSLKKSIAFSFLWAVGVAMVDESYQTTVSGRHGSIIDVGIDSCGVLIAVILIIFYSRLYENMYHK